MDEFKMTEFRKMRRFKQEITEAECIEVLKNAPRGVMAFHGENGYPYAIPLNQFYNEEDGKLYFHGAKEGLKLDLMAADNKVCFTVMDQGYRKQGDWALTIQSVICLGHLEIVEDKAAALAILRKLALKYYPTPEAAENEVIKDGARANMLVMTIDRMTGKRVHEA
ncbi:MAG: pyridoxamine 5'-phosphate oxidase family protein [Oribacterium sp.]|nr:pyridoxamine 5'-phosphate oxidase family protein [Oribacterium sp.]